MTTAAVVAVVAAASQGNENSSCHGARTRIGNHWDLESLVRAWCNVRKHKCFRRSEASSVITNAARRANSISATISNTGGGFQPSQQEPNAAIGPQNSPGQMATDDNVAEENQGDDDDGISSGSNRMGALRAMTSRSLMSSRR